MPSKRKKMRQEKRKRRGGEKAKSKSQDCCVTFTPKNYLLSTTCDIISFNQGLSASLCRVKRSFKQYQNEHNSVKDTGEKGKKQVTLTQKFPRKSCSTITHLPFLSYRSLRFSPKLFPPKWSLLNAQQAKKKGGKKSKKRGEGRKQKVKVKTAVSLLNQKTI